MNTSETKLLKLMYNDSKKDQKPGHFLKMYYPIMYLLKFIEVKFDDVKDFVQQGQYIELLDETVVDGGVRITDDGITYGQEHFDKP